MGILCNFVSTATATMADLLTLFGGQLLAVLATIVAILTLAFGSRK